MPKTPKAATAAPLALEGLGYSELAPLVETTLHAGISVLVRGHPGVGKSTLAADLAGRMNPQLIDIRLAQRDPAEICGVYFPNREQQVLDLFPPPWVREACEHPRFVFLDEVNAAVTKLHQAAAYQIVLEHRVGSCRFHKGTVVMAAGNLEEDNAIVSTLSSALANRFAHFILRVDARDWLAWAARASLPRSRSGTRKAGAGTFPATTCARWPRGAPASPGSACSGSMSGRPWRAKTTPSPVRTSGTNSTTWSCPVSTPSVWAGSRWRWTRPGA